MYAAYQARLVHGNGKFEESPDGRLTSFIVTEFLDGISLDDNRFAAMSKPDQDIIVQRLGEQIQLLRSVEPEPAGYYGHVNYQGWSPLLSHLRLFKPGLRGPYDTYEEFITTLCDSYELLIAIGCISADYSPLDVKHFLKLRQILPASKYRKPVMTHYDLQWRNIIVWPIDKSDQGETKDWKVAIIDWDFAGWAPEYMQKVSLKQRLWIPDGSGATVTFNEEDYKDEFDVLTTRAMDLQLL